MSDILNPLGGRFIGPSGSVTTTSVLGTVSDPPRGLLQVDPGTIIKGVVLGRESDGLTAIATDKGTVRVAANVPLPIGAQVTLEVRPAGDRLQVLILSNDLMARATTTTPPTMQTPGAATPTPVPQANTGGAQTSGTDARSAATGTSTPAATPPRAEPSIEFVGSSLRAVVVHAPPGPTPTPTPLPTTPQAPPQATPQVPPQAQTPQAPVPQPTPLPPAALPSQPQATPPQTQPPVPAPPQAQTPAPPPPTAQPTTSVPAGLPPSALPQSAPISVTPAPLPPPTTTSTTIPPVQGGQPPIPAGGTIPLPTTPIPSGTAAPPVNVGPIVLDSIPATTLTSAATVQAALLAAGAEKKDKAAFTVAGMTPQPPAPGQVASRNGTGAMPMAEMPEFQAAQSAAVPSGTMSGGMMPVASALTADAKQRILALFAAAGAMPDLAAESIKPTTGNAGAAPQILPLGAELKLRVLAVQMQAGQQIAIDPIALDPHDAQGQIIFGRVVSVTPAGHAVIHTPVGDIMLQNRSSLVPGAQLALAIDTLENAAPPVVPTPVVQTPQQALLTLSQGWPTLADLVALLQGSSPDAARAAVDADVAHQALAMLPHAGIRLGAGMMSAMAALRSGDLAKLLGPLLAAKGLGAEREEMVKRLKGEFSQLSAIAQDRPEVDWRALFLPVIDDQGRITQVNLFYRRSKKNEADPAERGSGTRFVVEADFSRLGPFQLDGLMRPQRFDLMVRSRQRLTDRMRREIEAIYEEARGLTGFAGSIAFQTVNEFPVIPLDDLKKGNPTYTV